MLINRRSDKKLRLKDGKMELEDGSHYWTISIEQFLLNVLK